MNYETIVIRETVDLVSYLFGLGLTMNPIRLKYANSYNYFLVVLFKLILIISQVFKSNICKTRYYEELFWFYAYLNRATQLWKAQSDVFYFTTNLMPNNYTFILLLSIMFRQTHNCNRTSHRQQPKVNFKQTLI